MTGIDGDVPQAFTGSSLDVRFQADLMADEAINSLAEIARAQGIEPGSLQFDEFLEATVLPKIQREIDKIQGAKLVQSAQLFLSGIIRRRRKEASPGIDGFIKLKRNSQ